MKKLWIILIVLIVLGSSAIYFLQVDSSSEEEREGLFVVSEIELCLPDALIVAVTDGLFEGDKVFEQRVRPLTVR